MYAKKSMFRILAHMLVKLIDITSVDIVPSVANDLAITCDEIIDG